jgi:hypothetical protein
MRGFSFSPARLQHWIPAAAWLSPFGVEWSHLAFASASGRGGLDRRERCPATVTEVPATSVGLPDHRLETNAELCVLRPVRFIDLDKYYLNEIK